ncbi:MAG: MBL fold metallo-hydrolase [Candidatus Heimdallarchaeota archaeon]|nr:MAG: MBL fold metallo-hydrolase [Candidatus Heimdallarchaeota archaeon]
MLKACVLASSSKGNATFVRIGNDRFLIDAGISARRINKTLREIGENTRSLKGVILTHEHQDHITGIKTLSHKYGLRFFSTFDTYQRIRKQVGSFDADFIEVGEDFQVGDEAIITPYEIQHDSADPVAFLIKDRNDIPLVGYLNDCGRITPFLIDGFRNVKVLIIEANHSFDLLLRSSYPTFLKLRILSSKGHLSNWSAAEFINATVPQIAVLSHRSEENNTPGVSLSEIETLLSDKITKPFIVIVPDKERSTIIRTLE